MVGFGPEDNHFVVELTYNYGIGSYKLGTDFRVSLLIRQNRTFEVKAIFTTMC